MLKTRKEALLPRLKPWVAQLKAVDTEPKIYYEYI